MIRTVKKELEINATPVKVTFEGIRALKSESGIVRGYWVETKEVRDLWLNNNTKNPENNFELFNLAEELGLEQFDDEKVEKYFNPKKGTEIAVSRVTRGEYINVHFGTSYSTPATEEKPFE